MVLVLSTNIETVLAGSGFVRHLELEIQFILCWHRVWVQQRQGFGVRFITTVVITVEVASNEGGSWVIFECPNRW